MADSILRLKVESKEYDQKIKRAAEGIQRYASECRKVGGTLEFVEKDTLHFVKSLGQMETVSKTAKGSLSEMTKAFTDLKMQYKQLTDSEKQSPFGRELKNSLKQLKSRIIETKKDLSDVQKELGGESSSNGLNGALSTLASKMGVSGDLMGMLTTGTIGYTAAIGAAATAVAYATQQWAAFNSELAKQQQITSVTTGLKGDDADRMTAAARAVSKVYGTDFREVINAANTLMSQFGQTGDEATQLIKDGMQGMVMGDGPKLLSMIQQYAPAFQSAGVSAKQLIAVIQNSEGGIFTDQNMQAIVMGISRLREMTNSTAEALRGIGINSDEMKQKMEDGSMSAFEALQTVGQAIEENKSKTNEVGVVMSAVFGRQGKMAGDNLGRAIAELNTNLEETKTQTGEVGESMKQLTERTEDFESKLIQVFGLDGWETMNNEIKSGVLVSLTQTLDRLGDIFHMLNGISRIDMSTSGAAKFFMDLATYAYEALNPILGVLDAISQIYKYFNGGSTGGTDDKLYNGGTIGDVVVTANRPRKTPRGGSGGGRVGRGGSVAEQTEEQLNTKKIQEYSREFETASAERQQWILKEIEVLKKRNEEIKYYQDYAQGKIRPAGADVANGQGIGLGTVNSGVSELLNKPIDVSNFITPLERMEEELKKLIELRDNALSSEGWRAGDALVKQKQQEIEDYKGGNEEKNSIKSLTNNLNKLSSGLSGISGGLKQMGFEVPNEIEKAIGVIQGLSSIIEGVQSIISIFSTSALAANTVAITANTSALLLNSSTKLIPFFANGGVVHAANGWSGVVPGASFSGDNVPILANSGEIVLNASQQSNLAQNLQGSGGGGISLVGVLKGENLALMLDTWGRRTGRGELLFGKNL